MTCEYTTNPITNPNPISSHCDTWHQHLTNSHFAASSTVSKNSWMVMDLTVPDYCGMKEIILAGCGLGGLDLEFVLLILLRYSAKI
jgi:hypothetical protein